MDQDSCHRVFHTCGHHTGPNPSPRPFLSVPYETPSWSPDSAGALAAGLHICSISAGAGAAAPHHAAVLHLQLHLSVWTYISQNQEEELIHHRTASIPFTLILEDIFLHFSMYRLYDKHVCEKLCKSYCITLFLEKNCHY